MKGDRARKQGCRDEEGRMKMRGRAETEQGEAGTVIEGVQAGEERDSWRYCMLA